MLRAELKTAKGEAAALLNELNDILTRLDKVNPALFVRSSMCLLFSLQERLLRRIQQSGETGLHISRFNFLIIDRKTSTLSHSLNEPSKEEIPEVSFFFYSVYSKIR